MAVRCPSLYGQSNDGRMRRMGPLGSAVRYALHVWAQHASCVRPAEILECLARTGGVLYIGFQQCGTRYRKMELHASASRDRSDYLARLSCTRDALFGTSLFAWPSACADSRSRIRGAVPSNGLTSLSRFSRPAGRSHAHARALFFSCTREADVWESMSYPPGARASWRRSRASAVPTTRAGHHRALIPVRHRCKRRALQRGVP